MKCLCCILATTLIFVILIPILLFVAVYQPRSFGNHPKHVHHVNEAPSHSNSSLRSVSFIESVADENKDYGVELEQGDMEAQEEYAKDDQKIINATEMGENGEEGDAPAENGRKAMKPVATSIGSEDVSAEGEQAEMEFKEKLAGSENGTLASDDVGN